MPMGGLGQRFRDAGIDTPKPLIDVLGTPMFQRALAAYDSYEGDKEYIFVVRKDIDDEYSLAKKILALLPDSRIAILNHNTSGAVETCLVAEEFINPELPLVIMDCDITFSAPNYFNLIKQSVENDSYDGLLLSFDSDDPRYSYALTNNENVVTQTAEKIVISKNALMGAYFFTNAATFLDAAHELVLRPLSDTVKEYYVSIIYNILIDNNKRVGLAKGEFTSFGTPEELTDFLARGA